MVSDLEAALASVDATILQFSGFTLDWKGASAQVMRSQWRETLAEMVAVRSELSEARNAAIAAQDAYYRDLGLAMAGI